MRDQPILLRGSAVLAACVAHALQNRPLPLTVLIAQTHNDASNVAISRTLMASMPSATGQDNGGLTAQGGLNDGEGVSLD